MPAPSRAQLRALLWTWARDVEQVGRLGALGSPLARIVEQGAVGAAIRAPCGPTIPLVPFSVAYWSVTRALSELPATGRLVALVEFGVGQHGGHLPRAERARRLAMAERTYRRWLGRVYTALTVECQRC